METPRNVSVADQLAGLQELRSSGAISDEEFKRFKEKIIATYAVSPSIQIDPTARKIGRPVPDGEVVAQAASFRMLKAVAGVVVLGGLAYALLTSNGQALFTSAITQAASQTDDIKLEASTSNKFRCEEWQWNSHWMTPCNGDLIPQLEILNRGRDITVDTVILNHRQSVPACNIPVGRLLRQGDKWSTYDKFSTQNYQNACGQLVHVEVVTNLGTEEYEFNN